MPKAIKRIDPSSTPVVALEQRGFAKTLVKWQRAHGRHDLPWQKNLHPYPVWLSEVMLQQTQVSTVRAYFTKFMDRFPTVQDLAQAHEDEVMSLWSGLGYYSRGRNLHACAKRVVQDFNGAFPSELKDLIGLPGIGPSTGAAIASICFKKEEAIMDGNVARVLSRYLGYGGDLSQSAHQRMLHAFAKALLPRGGSDMPVYTQGIMDLGATVCTPKRVLCERCPVRSTCVAFAQHKVLELPFKSKKIKRTQKSIYWLIAMNDQAQVLGAKRGLEGIWAGMHAFPEFESETTLRQALPRDVVVRPLSVIKHELTHQSLSIHGFACLFKEQGARLRAQKKAQKPWDSALNLAGFEWMDMAHWARVGRPKPVADFLDQLDWLA